MVQALQSAAQERRAYPQVQRCGCHPDRTVVLELLNLLPFISCLNALDKEHAVDEEALYSASGSEVVGCGVQHPSLHK